MKQYAAYYVAVAAAMQGAGAAPQSGRRPDPERGPGLPANHVVNTEVPTLVNSACYQNSTGQLERNADKSETNIKYPCISEQEIVGYCHQQFENDVEGMKNCLFNADSSYESDYKCCIACRNLNGDGSAGTEDDADKFIQGLKDRFVKDNAGNRRFADVAAELGKDIKPVQLKSTAMINEKGVADINILTYCPKPKLKLPQQAGSPKDAASTSTSAAPATSSAPAFKNTTKELKEHKFAQTIINFSYLGIFSYGDAKANVATNGSGSAHETGIVRMQQDFKLQYCVTCAAPGQSRAELEKSQEASISGVQFEPLGQKALPETIQQASGFQVDAGAGAPAETLAVVDLDQCSCLPPTMNSFTPASPAAIGDGAGYVDTYVEAGKRMGIDVRININLDSDGGPQSRPSLAEAEGFESPKQTNAKGFESPKQTEAKNPKSPKQTNAKDPKSPSTPSSKQPQAVPGSDAVKQEPVLYCE